MQKSLFILALLVGALVSQKHLDPTKSLNFDIKKYFDGIPNKLDVRLVDSAFEDFTKAYSKYYLFPGEKEARKKIFADSVVSVLLHNSDDNSLFQQEVNQFSDLTFDEFKKKFLAKNLEKEIKKDLKRYGRKTIPTMRLLERKMRKGPHKHAKDHHHHHHRRLQVSNLPGKVDWKSYSGAVKDQQHCAGCYAFSAVAGFESMRAIARGRREVYSEQSMIDCIKDNNGCISGTPGRVLDYIYYTGIASSSVYPFLAKTGTCNRAIMRRGRIVSDSIDYWYLDKGVLNILNGLKYGPVILIHTVSDAFRSYKSGVLNDPKCTAELNHSTLAVGYNLNTPVPYIEVRNSWGQDWGEKGYFRIAIGSVDNFNAGICQIANHDYNLEVDL
jgi:cathepsin H